MHLDLVIAGFEVELPALLLEVDDVGPGVVAEAGQPAAVSAVQQHAQVTLHHLHVGLQGEGWTVAQQPLWSQRVLTLL